MTTSTIVTSPAHSPKFWASGNSGPYIVLIIRSRQERHADGHASDRGGVFAELDQHRIQPALEETQGGYPEDTEDREHADESPERELADIIHGHVEQIE